MLKSTLRLCCRCALQPCHVLLGAMAYEPGDQCEYQCADGQLLRAVVEGIVRDIDGGNERYTLKFCGDGGGGKRGALPERMFALAAPRHDVALRFLASCPHGGAPEGEEAVEAILAALHDLGHVLAGSGEHPLAPRSLEPEPGLDERAAKLRALFQK